MPLSRPLGISKQPGRPGPAIGTESTTSATWRKSAAGRPAARLDAALGQGQRVQVTLELVLGQPRRFLRDVEDRAVFLVGLLRGRGAELVADDRVQRRHE